MFSNQLGRECHKGKYFTLYRKQLMLVSGWVTTPFVLVMKENFNSSGNKVGMLIARSEDDNLIYRKIVFEINNFMSVP